MTKTKSTKRALLMSALALLMCVSMLIGTTFAWFTDNVTSTNNIIKAGTLDVTMEWAEGDEDPATAQYKDASSGAIFDNDLWEPGYTEAKHIKIGNAGTLALKYQMRILANGVVSGLADVIDVYYYDTAVKLDRTNYASGTRLGTLSEVLNNTNPNAISSTIAGTLEAKASKTVTLVLHMQESAGNEYQGLSIGTDFSIQILATQYTSEHDTFNDQYDAGADFAPQTLPSAMVSSLTKTEKAKEATGLEWDLDAGYQFEPTETYAQATQSKYRWYHVDFEVSADRDVKANTVALAGYYEAWCSILNNNNWLGIPVDVNVDAGTTVRLLSGLVNVNYMEVCQYGNDGIGFRCGLVDLSDDGSNAGTTVTVKLNLYEVENASDPAGASGSHNVEVANAEPITIGTFTYTFPAKKVADQTGLNNAIANGASAIELGKGSYSIPAAVAGKEVTITGSGENTVIDLSNKTANVGDASITFENLKIVGKNSNTMNGYGIQHTTGDIVYRNCTFENAVTSEFYGNVAYYDCKFVGTYYIATYAVKSAIFERCVFDRTDSRALLVYSHGNNPVEVIVKDCEFMADDKGYTTAPAWTAAVEVDTTNITSAGTTVTIEGCTYDANYNGIVRDKSASGKENSVIKFDGVIVDNTTIKTTGYAG